MTDDEVTQADRVEAAKLCSDAGPDYCRSILRGEKDNTSLAVKSFARHRIEATRTAAAELEEARALLERCRDREHNSFEPSNQTKLRDDIAAYLEALTTDAGGS